MRSTPKTGQLISGFAEEGRHRSPYDLGRDPAEQFITDTSPPVVYKDFLIVGSLVNETLPAAPGDFALMTPAPETSLVFPHHSTPRRIRL